MSKRGNMSAAQAHAAAEAAKKATGNEASNGYGTKYVPPMTNEEFISRASSLPVKIGETLEMADPRAFSTGSVGYFLTGKVTIMVDGVPMKFQVSCSIIGVGTK